MSMLDNVNHALYTHDPAGLGTKENNLVDEYSEIAFYIAMNIRNGVINKKAHIIEAIQELIYELMLIVVTQIDESLINEINNCLLDYESGVEC